MAKIRQTDYFKLKSEKGPSSGKTQSKVSWEVREGVRLDSNRLSKAFQSPLQPLSQSQQFIN